MNLKALVKYADETGKRSEIINPENIVIFRGDKALFEIDSNSRVKDCIKGRERSYTIDGETENNFNKGGRMIHDSMPDEFEGDVESQAYLADRYSSRPKSSLQDRQQKKRNIRLKMYGDEK